jgi:hypothetical protein
MSEQVRIRQQPESSDSKSPGSLQSELLAHGFSSLRKISFHNIRLIHSGIENGTSAGNEIMSTQPDVVLLEMPGTDAGDIAQYQAYIESRTGMLPQIFRDPFYDGMFDVIREAVSAGAKCPVLICTDIQKNDPLYDETRTSHRNISNALSAPLRGEIIPYEEAVRRVTEALRNGAGTMTQREDGIVHKLADALAQSSLPKDSTSITIAAPYGSKHGRLNSILKSQGVETHSHVIDGDFEPAAALERKYSYGQEPSKYDVDAAVIGTLVNFALINLSNKRKLPELSDNERNRALWRLTRLLLKRLPADTLYVKGQNIDTLSALVLKTFNEVDPGIQRRPALTRTLFRGKKLYRKVLGVE